MNNRNEKIFKILGTLVDSASKDHSQEAELFLKDIKSYINNRLNETENSLKLGFLALAFEHIMDDIINFLNEDLSPSDKKIVFKIKTC